MFTPEFINSLEPNQIFVFGSNTAGIHGAGAAKAALKWGAKWGQGHGLAGQTYALPTKGDFIETLSLPEIKEYIAMFLDCAQDNPDKQFLLTKVGCGLAGLKISDVAELFVDFLPLTSNVVVPKEFFHYWAMNTNKAI